MNYHEKYKSFYQQKEWRELREQVFIEANGLCEDCYQQEHLIKSIEE